MSYNEFWYRCPLDDDALADLGEKVIPLVRERVLARLAETLTVRLDKNGNVELSSESEPGEILAEVIRELRGY